MESSTCYVIYEKHKFTSSFARCTVCAEEAEKKNRALPEYQDCFSQYIPNKDDTGGVWRHVCKEHQKTIACKTVFCCRCGRENMKRPVLCNNCASLIMKNCVKLYAVCKVDELGLACKCEFCKVRN